MRNSDWFRNAEWNAEVEVCFWKKLRRAKHKSQYLRIQASCLAESHPKMALHLLDEYFALGEHFDWAQAFVAAAHAHLSLGKTDEAIQSLQKALERERQYPHVKTAAWSEFALLVADQELESHFEDALQVLNEHQSGFTFPVEVFKWNAASALIKARQGHRQTAKEHAIAALDAAKKNYSGFRYHPRVGLVGKKYKLIKDRLFELSAQRC